LWARKVVDTLLEALAVPKKSNQLFMDISGSFGSAAHAYGAKK